MASTHDTTELKPIHLKLSQTTRVPSIPSDQEIQNLPVKTTDVLDGSQEAVSMDEEESMQMDRNLERRLVWKIDLFILPMLTTIYFLSQMGRSDVGNAKIAGMGNDLHITPSQYSMITSVFLVGYTVFQPAGTLLIHLLTPPIQFGGAVFAWGVVTVCHLKADSYAALLVLRFFVGVSESFVQGTILYLSFWYTYRELALRGAIFYATGSLAGAFNGLISYAISIHLNGKNGWPAWKWIFFIEGLIPMGFSIFVSLLLPAFPRRAKFGFSEAEKVILVKRTMKTHNTADTKLRPRLILKAIIDPKVILFSLAGGGNHFAMTSLSNFLPDIVVGLGYNHVNAQLMTVIVYACAFVSTIFWGRLSDKLNRRGIPMMISSLVMAIGYTLLLTTDRLEARFAATCLVALGGFPVVVLVLMWMVVNVVGYTKRGTALAMINIVGQVCGIGGNHAYRDPPLYRTGHSSALGAIFMTFLISVGIYFYLIWQNKIKRRNQYNNKSNNDRMISYDIIGDSHPDFFYTL